MEIKILLKKAKTVIYTFLVFTFIHLLFTRCNEDENQQKCIDEKEYKVFNDFYITIPCPFDVRFNEGNDGYSFEARKHDEKVVLTYQRSIPILYDTLYDIPSVYLNIYDQQKLIFNENNEEVGILLYHELEEGLRPILAFFFCRIEDYYYQMMVLSYSKEEEETIFNILSTFKKM